MATRSKYLITGWVMATPGRSKDLMLLIRWDSTGEWKDTRTVVWSVPTGRMGKWSLQWLTILPSPDSIHSTVIISDYGDPDHAMNLISTASIVETMMVLSMRDRRPNTSHRSSTRMTPQRQVRNSDWSNSTSSALPRSETCSEDIRRTIRMTGQNSLRRIRYNWMIHIQPLRQSNYSGYWLMRRNYLGNKPGI